MGMVFDGDGGEERGMKGELILLRKIIDRTKMRAAWVDHESARGFR